MSLGYQIDFRFELQKAPLVPLPFAMATRF